MTLLLPHGYEGGGPEHSSARLERYLQMCAEGNICVAYPSTPAQYFHIIRRQAKRLSRRPLVLMQPKSLLRLPAAASKLGDLATGAFRPVIDDDAMAQRREQVKRIVFCTGKVYYDLLEGRRDDVAIVRVEELYPWPHDDVARIVDSYPAISDVVWAQEEPKNMGGWGYVWPRLRVSTGNAIVTRYVGRPERASPSEGYASDHAAEQQRIVTEAFTSAAAGTERTYQGYDALKYPLAMLRLRAGIIGRITVRVLAGMLAAIPLVPQLVSAQERGVAAYRGREGRARCAYACPHDRSTSGR